MTPHDNDLVLTRVIPVTPDKLWRCWSEPDLLKQWFAPKPYSVPEVHMDLRAGGASLIVMADPDGNRMPMPGVYLEVEPGRKIVFTDAYSEPWVPSAKPFMTGIVTLEPHPEGTLYTARVRHWTAEDREAHEKMGFHEGWGKCADQLAELAKSL